MTVLSESSRLLVRRLLELHPAEAAHRLAGGSATEAAKLLAREETGISGEVLRRMEPDFGARVLLHMEDGAVAQILTPIDPSVSARLLSRLAEQDRVHVLGQLPEALAKEIGEILSYPPGTAGALMDAQVATFSLVSTVSQALERVREMGDRRVTDLVLTDADGDYAGVVRLQDAAGADPGQALGQLRAPEVLHVHPMSAREEVVELINQHRLTSLPVLDLQDQVVGIIRHAALVDAARQDVAADMGQMVGASKVERALSPPWVGVRGRLPWLHINLVTAFMAAAVVGLFEDTIAQFTALAVLLPVVAGQSGNTGAQALAVTMRGLALREMRTSQAVRVLVKEITIGCINGLAIATVTSVGVFAWSRSFGLALVMFLAMLLSMIIASMAGVAVPVTLVKLGRDPATASSIILTTVTDVVGFFSFLGLATLLSGMLAAIP